MKLTLLKILLLVVLSAMSRQTLAVYVRGHYRNGHWVNGYERRSPGSSSYSRPSSPSTWGKGYEHRDPGISSYSRPGTTGRGYGSYSVGPDTPSPQPIRLNAFESRVGDSESRQRLTSCEALNDNGYPCQRPANPGGKYCFKHLDYKTPQEVAREREKKLSEYRRKHGQTTLSLGMIKREVERYQRVTSGKCPDRISEKDIFDAWGRPIFYNTDGTNYVLASDGPDGTAETDDDLVYVSNTNLCCLALLKDNSQCQSLAVSNELFCIRHLKQNDGRFSATDGTKDVHGETSGNEDVSNEESCDEDSFGEWFMYVNTFILIVVVAIVWKTFRRGHVK